MLKPKRTELRLFARTLWSFTKRGFVVAGLSLFVLPLFFLTRAGTPAYAATNDTLNFQARLENAAGAIAPDGYYNVEFKLYDQATSSGSSQGSCSGDSHCLWVSSYDYNGGSPDHRVRVANGYLTVNLGDITAFSSTMPWDQQLYLTMNIGGTGTSASYDGEMTPRLKLTAVPYAFNAKTASQLQTSNGALNSSLSIQAPTGGSQTFEITDQGAAGTYNILVAPSGSDGYVKLQSATPGSQQTGNFNISGTGIVGGLLQGGTLKAGNAQQFQVDASGNVTTSGSLSTGSGSLLTVGGATLNNSMSIGDLPSGGNIGTAATTVDIYTNFTIAQTTAGQTLTIPAPTTTTTGRLIYITNVGSAGYTLGGSIASPGTTMAFVWNSISSTWTLVSSGTSGNYIQNGTAIQTANFNIQSNNTGDVTATIQGANSQSANILEVKAAGVSNPLFSVSNTGSVTFQNSTDSTTAFSIKQAGGTALFAADTLNGTLGIGTAPTTGEKVSVASTGTTGLKVQNTSTTSTGGVRTGAIFQSTASGSSADSVEGVNGFALSTSSATLQSAAGGRFVVTNTNGTITDASGIQTQVNAAGGAITNAYGIYVNSSASGAAITNNYGIYIDDQTTAGSTLKYNLYSAGATAKNYFAGYLQSGTSVQAPIIDTVTASALEIGTTNATSVDIKKNVNIAGNTLTFTGGTTNTITTNSTSAFQLLGGTGTGSGYGGGFNIYGGTGGTSSGVGGDVYIAGGWAGGGNADGGATTVRGGNSAGTGNGGALTLQGGPAVGAGLGGAVTIDGGTTSGGTEGTISIGTATASSITIGKVGVTTTIAGSTSVTLQASSSTTLVCSNSGVLSSCDSSVLSPTATNFIQNQNSSQQTANYWISGAARADTSVLTPLLDTASAVVLNIGTTNATSIHINQDTVLAAGKSITIAGGNTASRPASPTEGMLYYDTDTHQLIQYNGSKWVSDRSSNTKIVAPSSASQAVKDSADYVANGTSDQTAINSALTAAAGGTVLLLPGTYTTTGTILVPDNTTLAGSGANTTIVKLNVGSSSDNLVENSNTSTGSGVSLKDLMLDGSLGTGGTQNGIYLNGMTDNKGGATFTNLSIINWDNGNGLVADNGSYIHTFSNNNLYDNGTSSLSSVSLDHTSGIDSFTGNDMGDLSLSNTSYILVLNNNVGLNLSASSSGINTATGNMFTGVTLTSSSNVGTFSGNTIQDVSVQDSSITTFGSNKLQSLTLDNSGIETFTGNQITSTVDLNGGTGGNAHIETFAANKIYGTITLDAGTAGFASVANFNDNTVADVTLTSGVSGGASMGVVTGNNMQQFTIDGGTAGGASVGTFNDNNAESISADGSGGGSVAVGSIDGNNIGSIYLNTVPGPVEISGNIIVTASTNAIELVNADDVSITSNTFKNNGGATNAINIDSASDNAHLAGNKLGGLAVVDASATTVYGGQLDASDNYVIQPAGAIDLNADTNISGALIVTGDGTFQGGTVTLGTTSQAGSVVVSAGNGFTGTLSTAALTGNRTYTLPDASGTFCLDSGNCSTAGSGYILNQSSTPGTAQTGNFNISGTGIAGTSLLTPLLDTPSGTTTLNIGTTNATAGINLNQSTTVAAGKNLTVDTNSLFVDGTNHAVQIGSTTPLGAKLAIVGTADQTQLLIRANSTQNITNSPLMLVQDSAGSQLFSVRAPVNTTIAIGNQSAASSTTAATNSTFLGYFAGNHTAATENTAIGSNALLTNVSGAYNTAVGAYALQNSTSSNNTAVGDDAGISLTSGANNTYLGSAVANYNQTGGNNTVVGYQAGFGVTGNSYTNNTILGYQAGYALQTGSSNVLLGYQAGNNITTGGSNIIIGNVAALSATASNQLNIGNTIYGDTSAGTIYVKATASSAFSVKNSGGTAALNVDTSVNNVSFLGSNTGDTGTWVSNTNQPAAGRQFPGAVYANGYIYMIGGLDGTPTSSRNVYYAKVNADGTPGTWTLATNILPGARGANGVAYANGRLYSFGGIDSGGNASSTVYYAQVGSDGAPGAWQTDTAHAISATRSGASTVVMNGYAYVIGGEGTASALGQVANNAQNSDYYTKLNADGTVNTWANAGNTSLVARRLHSSVAANGYIYQIGGQDTTGAPSATVQYTLQAANGTVGTWTNTSSLPAPVDSAAAVIANGYVYVMGGRTTSGTIQSAIYYAKINTDGTLGSWQTSSKTLVAARYGVAGLAINGNLYTIAGYNAGIQTTVYSAPVAKVQINGDLDLVGLQGGTLAGAGSVSQGSIGGNLTAGNITAVGALTVQGDANFASSLSVAGNVSIGNTGMATTSFLSPLIDVPTGGATLSLGTSTATGVTIGGTTNTTAVTLQGAVAATYTIGTATGTGTITLGQSTAGQTINIGAAQIANGNTQTIHIGDSATGTGKDVITIGNTNGASSLGLNAGSGGATLNATAGNLTLSTTTSGTLAVTSAGALNLTGAAASTINYGANTLAITSNAFNVTSTGGLTLGSGAGTGSLTNNGSTVNTVYNVGNLATGGWDAGGATATVDKYTYITVAQTTASQTVTVPAPTNNTIYGRVIYLSNIGTASFTLGSTTVSPGTTATLVWSNTNGGASWQFAGADGNGILNQNSSDQTANFRITGTGQANTSILTPLLDTPSGTTTLNIGTTNATAGINLNHDTQVTGKLTVSTGAIVVSGTTNFNSAISANSNTIKSTVNTNQYGIQLQSNFDLTTVTGGTLTNLYGIINIPTISTAGTVSNAYGQYARVDNANAGASITNSYGMYIDSGTQTGTTTNKYGIVINNITGGTANIPLRLVGSSGNLLNITNAGVTTFRTTTNQAGAFAVQSSGNTSILSVDTQNSYVQVAGVLDTTASATLSLGTVNATGVTIGGTTNTTAVTLQGAVAATYTIGTATGTGNITLGQAASSSQTVYIESANGTSSTQTVDIAGGTSTTSGGKVVNIANGVPGAGTTNTVAIATGGSTTGTVGVTIGSATAANHTLLLQGGNSNTAGSEAIRLQTSAAGGIAIGTAAQTGTITLGQATTAATQTVNIESANGTSSTQTVNIGAGTSTTAGGKVVNIATGTPGAGTTNTVAIGNGGTTTGTVGVTIGSNGAANHTLLLQGGNSNTAGSEAVRIQTAAAGGIAIGTAAQTGTLTFGQSTAGQTINIGAAQVATGNTQTIHIGDSATGTGKDVITIGNTNGASSLGLNAGSGGATLNATAGNLTLSTTTSGTLAVTSAGALNLTGAANSSWSITGTLGIDSTGLLSLGTANASGVTISKQASTTTVASSTIVLGTTGFNTTIQGATQGTLNTAGNNLTITASAGNGTGSGGTLNLSGGAAGGGGTSVMGLVSLSPTTFVSSGTTQSFSSNGSVTGVDSYSSIAVTSSGTSLTVTVPVPAAAGQVVGRILYVTAVNGTNDFTLALANTSGVSGSYTTVGMKANNTATLVWNGYAWTAAGASSATDLQAAYNNTQTSAGGAELVLNAPGGAADGLTIRNNGTPITGALFEVQSSIATDLFSVNNNTTEYAVNGGAENSTFNGWTALTSTVTQNTNTSFVATGRNSVKVVTTANNRGALDTLSTTLTASTTYVVSFAARVTTGGPNTLNIYYSTNGTANSVSCNSSLPGSGYTSTSNFSVTTSWTKVSCFITTPSSGLTAANGIQIYETDLGSGTFYIDNLSVISNASSTTPANVQIGGGAYGGQPTIFTLDQFAGPPMGSGNSAYLGSMYYDLTKGTIQCYQSSGWGACGSAPDDIVTLTPEYTGAVLDGTGVGTMTADFCGNGGGLSVNTGFCASGEARNYYKWTSPQPTSQTYSVYVTYKLPSTFKTFVNGSTSLTGLVDSTSNAGVSYAIYRKASGGGLTSCSASTTVVGSGSGSANTWTTTAPGTDPSTCTSFVAGDSIVFQISVTAKSNASAYIENLNFQYSNK